MCRPAYRDAARSEQQRSASYSLQHVCSRPDGEAIGTSGDYQRYFELDGERLCHLIDPRTGQPVRHTQSLTVLMPAQPDAGARSDADSKPLFIAGRDDWMALSGRMGVSHVLRIDADGSMDATTAMRARLR